MAFRPRQRAADTPQPDDRAVEAELVRRLADGDAEALREAYSAHGGLVFGIAHRVLGDHQAAEECTQDVFMTLWRTAATIDTGRARLGTWLYVVARNRALSLQRSAGARPATPMADPPDVEAAPDAAALVEQHDERRRIVEALAELPDEQRAVVGMAYFEGLSQGEIARRLDIPLGTVKGRARLALDRLRTIVGDDPRGGDTP